MFFSRVYRLLVVSLILISVFGVEQKKMLSRKRRYLAFPEGASFVVLLCLSYQSIAGVEIFYQGVNFGAAFSLPNRSSIQEYAVNHKKRRRERRDMYSKIETTLEEMGLEGRPCIYRALCEASRRFMFKSSKLSEELLRIIFKFPLQYLSQDEPDDHHLYHKAYRSGKQEKQQDCKEIFPECSISLIDLALGDYSNDGNT
nr:uncharacterized protein LOC111506549 isoform X1 [Leptinotarsa decemlineata]